MWEIVVSLPGLTSEAGAIGPEVLVPAKAHLPGIVSPSRC